MWTLAIVLAVPIISVVVGLGLLLLAFMVPQHLMPKGCGCCGRSGFWTHRNSLGVFICDDCAQSGAHAHEPRGTDERYL